MAKRIKRLSSEYRKAIVTGITAAFGLIMALAWKDVINEYISKLDFLTSAQGALITALIITFLAVVGISIVSKLAPREK